MRAQEAMLIEVAKSKLRRFSAHNQTVNCMDVSVGDMVLFYENPNRKGLPRWKGPAKVLELDETGVTVSFESKIFKVTRFCIRRRVPEPDIIDQDGHAPRPTKESWIGNCHTEEAGGFAPRVAFAQGKSPTLDSPTYEKLHHCCKSHGYGEKDAKTMSKTSMDAMDTVDMSLSGSRRGARSGSNPQMTTMPHQLAEGSDGVANAWLVNEGDRLLSQELSEEDDLAGKELAPEGKMREIEAGKQSMVVSYVKNDIAKVVIDSRWD